MINTFRLIMKTTINYVELYIWKIFKKLFCWAFTVHNFFFDLNIVVTSWIYFAIVLAVLEFSGAAIDFQNFLLKAFCSSTSKSKTFIKQSRTVLIQAYILGYHQSCLKLRIHQLKESQQSSINLLQNVTWSPIVLMSLTPNLKWMSSPGCNSCISDAKSFQMICTNDTADRLTFADHKMQIELDQLKISPTRGNNESMHA